MRLDSIARIAGMLALCALSSDAETAGAARQQATTLDRTGIRLSGLMDRAIQNEAGEFAGVIRELILDPSQGFVRLVVVELRDSPDRPIGVPWSYIAVREDSSVVWRATAEQLRGAPSYVSGAEGLTAAPSAARDQSMVTYAPSQETVDHFDPARVATYRGVVIGTMTAAFQGELEDVVAVVEAADARKIRARLGPEFYLTQIGLGLTPGESVVLQGFSTEGEDPPLVVVSEVIVREKKYVLRNVDGTPLWSRANVPKD
jgi:sporulation protein YlmC with PRC-barrel domain